MRTVYQEGKQPCDGDQASSIQGEDGLFHVLIKVVTGALKSYRDAHGDSLASGGLGSAAKRVTKQVIRRLREMDDAKKQELKQEHAGQEGSQAAAVEAEEVNDSKCSQAHAVSRQEHHKSAGAATIAGEWGDFFQNCDDCITKTHCAWWRRCLNACTPLELGLFVGFDFEIGSGTDSEGEASCHAGQERSEKDNTLKLPSDPVAPRTTETVEEK